MRNLDINVENLCFLPYPRFTPQEKSRTFIFREKRYIRIEEENSHFSAFSCENSIGFNNAIKRNPNGKRNIDNSNNNLL